MKGYYEDIHALRTAKKQSQFSEGKIGVNLYMKGAYDKISLCGAQENKANPRPFGKLRAGSEPVRLRSG